MPRTNTEIEEDLGKTKESLRQAQFSIVDLQGGLQALRGEVANEARYTAERRSLEDEHREKELGSLRFEVAKQDASMKELVNRVEGLRKELLEEIREVRRSRENFQIAIVAVLLGAVGSGLIELLKYMREIL